MTCFATEINDVFYIVIKKMHLLFELQYPDKLVAGVDEAGRGPLAGPVVAAAVVLDQSDIPDGIRDSKKLSAAARDRLYDLITKGHLFGIGVVSAAEIDQINILEATKKACSLAVEDLKSSPDIVLVDGNMKVTIHPLWTILQQLWDKVRYK